MTGITQTLTGTFGMTDFLVPLVLEDLSDEDARKRSREGEGPSIAWTVGHLMHYRYYVMSMLGDERVDPAGETFTQAATEGSDYPTLGELQEQWGAALGALRKEMGYPGPAEKARAARKAGA